MIVIHHVQRLDQDALVAQMRTFIEKDPGRNVLVYVHGYNTSFESAIRQAAQITYDIGFHGVSAAFSWPSNDRKADYIADEADAEWAEPHLAGFLTEIISKTQPDNVFIIAHSMGARILARAIRSMPLPQEGSHAPAFAAIILAAPDIDRDILERDLGKEIARVAEIRTMYVSAHDKALRLSGFIHGRPRAGDARGEPCVVDGVETVDATNVRSDFLEHSYFAENASVIADIYRIVGDRLGADARGLIPARTSGYLSYWCIR